MAQADRVYGKDLSVFSVAGGDIVAYIAEANIDFSVTTIDGTFLQDTTTGNIANRTDYTVSWSMVYDGVHAGTALIIDAVGTEIAFSVTAVASGQVYSGTGLLHMGRHNIPDGGQTLDFEIIPNGSALTK
jgi:hypothetical protein